MNDKPMVRWEFHSRELAVLYLGSKRIATICERTCGRWSELFRDDERLSTAEEAMRSEEGELGLPEIPVWRGE